MPVSPRLAVAFAVAVFAAMALAGCDPSASLDAADGPAVSTEWYATVPGTAGSDYAQGVAELPGGDVVVVGYTYGGASVVGPVGAPVSLGSDPNTSGNAGYVARLSPAGAVRWATPLATGGFGTAFDVAAVPGGVVVLGEFAGTVRIGQTTVTSSGGQSAFVARLSDAGAVTWVRTVDSPNVTDATEFASDAAGNVTMGGSFRTSVTAGGTTRTAAGSVDAWMARIAPDGTVAWLTAFGGTAADGVNAVAVGPGGEAYVAGNFAGTAAVGPETFTSAGGRDGFALRVESDGRVAWARHLAGAGSNDYFVGAGASAGGVAFAGLVSGAATFGGQSAPGAGMVAAGITPEGSVRWLTAFGGTGACSAGMDAAGGLVVGGTYTGAGAFGGRVGGRYGGGETDGYIARFTPAGALDWVRTQNGVDDDGVCGVAAGAEHAYASGWYGFSATLDGAAWPVESLLDDDGFVARFRLAPAPAL